LWPATDQEPHCQHAPITEFEESELNLPYEADDDAGMWLEFTAIAALMK